MEERASQWLSVDHVGECSKHLLEHGRVGVLALSSRMHGGCWGIYHAISDDPTAK